jgi:transcriptional regulator GlxA family with amidase domain
MVTLGIILYDGFDSLDAIGPWEVFRKAEIAGARLSTRFLARERSTPIVSSDGLTMTNFEPLESATVDWLITPGGAWASRAPKGAWAEIQEGTLPAILKQRSDAGTKMASVCTGAMLLSAAGLTKGREVATHWIAKDELREQGALVINARVVDDGDLVSSAGVTAGIDLALWLVEQWNGKDLADSVARTLEWKRDRDTHLGANRAPQTARS